MKTVLLVVTGLSLGWGVGYLPIMLSDDLATTVAIDQAELDNEESNLLWSVDLTELKLGTCYDN